MADPSAASSRQKPSIYAAPPTDVLLLDDPSALEAHIGTARRAVTGQYRQAHAQVQSVVSQWIGVENRIESRVKSLLPPDERLVPGTLYAAIAFLSGSILARHRLLPTRLLLPPLLGSLAFAHFLPKTSHNIRSYAADLEDAHFPSFAEKHDIGKAHAGMAWARLEEGVKGAGESVKGGVMRALEGVQGATGLRVREALGVVREMEGKAERVVEERVEDLKGKAKALTTQAEKVVDAKVEKVKERVV
ncbi:MICOS complex subunit [Favolaschia claudopus]|uniref:MICOS complex subunit n=1 Tax=Favolaschia claudopus TaxID=2862362 RepID=A0AAW0B0R6_9AGAR